MRTQCKPSKRQKGIIEELADCHEYRDGCSIDGAEKIEDGRGRVVYDIEGMDKCVTKVARWDVGIDDNISEATMYDNLTYKEQDYFAEVGELGDSGRWITMERIDGDVTKEEIKEWQNMLILAGNYRRTTCGDNLPKNFGKENGEVKRVDWGQDCTKNC